MVTSTPVNQGSRFKKLITPSKISNYPKLSIDNLVENTDSDQENLLLLPPKEKFKFQKVNPSKSKIQKDNPTKSKIQNSNLKAPRLPIDNPVENIDSDQEDILLSKAISTKSKIQEAIPTISKMQAVNPTKSKIQDGNPKLSVAQDEDFEDSFDRMCNVKTGFCLE